MRQKNERLKPLAMWFVHAGETNKVQIVSTVEPVVVSPEIVSK